MRMRLRMFGKGSTGLVAPVLVKDSAAGANPLTWSAYYENAQVGDVIRLYWTVNGVAGAGDTHTITSGDMLSASEGAGLYNISFSVFDALTFTSGQTVAVWERIERGAAASAISNVVSDTMAETVNNDVILAEGDSITGSFSPSYVDLFVAAYPSYTMHNTAVGGSVILGGAPSLQARKTTDRAYDAEVASFFIGSNDIGSYTDAQGFYDTLIAHVAAFRTDGAKVVLCTPPFIGAVGGYVTHNAYVATVSGLMRAGVGTDFDQLADFTASPMGSQAAMDNTTYSPDKQHFTAAGHQAVYPNWRGAVLAALGVSHDVAQFTFTDNGSATASAVTTSDAIMVQGLAYGESKAVSVSGGEYRKTPYTTGTPGSWGTTAGTVVVGDLIEVRGTASGTPAATVNVVLTIGGVSDTFAITTAAAGESPSSWATSTGQDKSTWVTVSGTGNRVARGTAGFASVPTSVRNPTERAGKRWAELAASTRGVYPLYIGLDDGTDYLGDGGVTNYTRPGKDNSSGISFSAPNNLGTWNIHYGGTSQQSGSATGDIVNGSRLGIEYDWDDASNMLLSCKFFTYKSGTWTQIGSTVTNVAMSHCYLNCGFEDDTTLTAALAVADQIRTPNTGFVPHDN